ncbi:hypothetical protein MATL_G00195280 [Megalops atlanticus]|uniref:Uncharacterized protein n=1 Tax=Megalops atlanticus TaxID=7932 RepID=A0A9D3PNC1_MEGAT|nr:hypothetical protein MATL_G00195280 [Megalops atlanticus]
MCDCVMALFVTCLDRGLPLFNPLPDFIFLVLNMKCFFFSSVLCHQESFVAHDFKNSRGYHWDTSDWMPNVHLPGIQEFPQYDILETHAPLYSDPDVLDTDYYPGGFDIENDFMPPLDNFPIQDDLPPLPERSDRYDTLRPPRDLPPPDSPGSSTHSQQHLYSLHKYLPQHQYPTDLLQPQDTALGARGHSRLQCFPTHPQGQLQDAEAPSADSVSLSLCTSTASCSDASEAAVSEYESGDKGHLARITVPVLASSQHTEV